MKNAGWTNRKWIAAGAAATLLLGAAVVSAQPPAGFSGRGGRGGRGGFGRGGRGPAPQIFAALDADKDGSLTRAELKSAFDAWFTAADTKKSGAVTEAQLVAALQGPLPIAPIVNAFDTWGNSIPLTAAQNDVDAMMAALPTTPGAKPLKARKVLVFAHTGPGGWVHGSIPLTAKTVEALGNKGDLWSTTISYSLNDITAANLKQYDAIFLDSTTACFLDDADAKATAARRAAFLNFVRSGKGVAGIHAATDSYHWDCTAASQAAATTPPPDADHVLATQFLAQGDANHDGKLSRQELASLADSWYDKLDTDKSGKVSQADFDARLTPSVIPAPARAPQPSADAAVQQWPEFNKLIGGFFKFHWPDPQLITVKIDDPASPLTAMFHGQEFEIHDETYTFNQDSFSRKNVHVLTSIDYDKMSDADKARESHPRTDHDYALSYIRREGKGRVFYEGHGHSPRVYAMTPMLEHLRAGIQYALGDLKADDKPSAN
ncbi:MAG TPA: ThuA domain-containing protein [Bryobacteraceae bacterium]|nr:ThuA domain-containing protein [Bryobacteraceae bacterium]